MREYIYKNGYKIIDEELCIDDSKFYEIIKIKYDNNIETVDGIFYEIGEKLLNKNHSLVKDFIEYKIEQI